MEALLSDLAKLEAIAAHDGKGKSPAVSESLGALLEHLEAVQTEGRPLDRVQVLNLIDAKKKEIIARQREIHTAIARFGKTLDKVCQPLLLNAACACLPPFLLQKFPTPLPSYPGLFSSTESHQALEKTVALHLLRRGQFEAAETLLQVCPVLIP